jgi:opacity protein-like surface antigen
MKRVVGIVCLCLALSAAGFAEGVSLRLTGGMYYMIGGDYNNILQGRTDYYHSLSSLNVTGDLSKMILAANFGLELVVDITNTIGIGLGVGFLHATNDAAMQAVSGSNSIQEEFTPLLTSFPIMLNLHITIPVTENVNVHLSGGPGAYFSVFKFNRSLSDTSTGLDQTLFFDSTTATSFGFQGSLGLEYHVSDSVCMFAEVKGRSAFVSGFTGPWSLTGADANGTISASGAGPVWYEEVQTGTSYYADMVVKGKAPSGSDLRNVRLSRISLGGIGLQVGLKFSL